MKPVLKIFVIIFFLITATAACKAQKPGSGKKNAPPEIKSLSLDGKAAGSRIRLNPQEKYMISMLATDPDSDPLTMRWELFPELQAGTSTEQTKPIADSVSPVSKVSAMLHVPMTEGVYRLWLYVDDSKGHTVKSSIVFTVLPN